MWKLNRILSNQNDVSSSKVHLGMGCEDCTLGLMIQNGAWDLELDIAVWDFVLGMVDGGVELGFEIQDMGQDWILRLGLGLE